MQAFLDWAIAKITKAAADGGIYLAIIIAAFITIVVVAWIYLRADLPIFGTPPATTEQHIIAASGEQGFDVEPFACDDPLTRISGTVAPDASGITYTLQRTRDGRTETVVLVRALDGTWPYAKHFWEDDKQNANSAFVSDKALACIERKAR